MNNKGFVMISTVIFLPLLLIAAFGTLWTIWFINQKHSLDNICHQHVLHAQEKLVRGNSRLMSLNNQARGLIIQKKALTAAILFGTPSVKAAAHIQRRRVIIQQKVLRSAQQTILHGANAQSQLSLFKLKRSMEDKFQEIARFWKASPAYPNIIISWKPSQVVKAWKDIAPTYKRKTQHSHKQALQVYWTYDLHSTLPHWLQKIVRTSKAQWKGECFSHPHKGGLKWFAATGKGNH